jgi:hypothetical protein
MVQRSSHKPKSSLLVSPVQTPSSASHHRMTKISVQGSGHNKPPANRLVKEGRFLDPGPFPPTPMLPGGLGQEPHQNSIQRLRSPALFETSMARDLQNTPTSRGYRSPPQCFLVCCGRLWKPILDGQNNPRLFPTVSDPGPVVQGASS